MRVLMPVGTMARFSFYCFLAGVILGLLLGT